MTKLTNSQPSQRRARLSLSKKLLFSCFVTVVFFAVLELSLAVLRIEPVAKSADPFLGFSSSSPLYVEDVSDTGEAIMRTADGKQVWFNPQSFPRNKPKDTRRVVCLGGSTTFGRPFDDGTSYCEWLRRWLPEVDPSHRWEVINAGGVSYASYRVAAVMEEMLPYEPDLFIVLSAHNEFLERRTYASMFEQPESSRRLSDLLHRSRTWTLVSELVGRSSGAGAESKDILPAEVDEMLNHSAGPTGYHPDPEWTAKVVSHYRLNLTRMAEMAQQAEIPIVFVSPAINLRDCSPFKSNHRDGLSDQALADFEARFSQLQRAAQENTAEAGDWVAWEELLSIDPSFAAAQFEFGRALFRAGRFRDARRALQRASDQDICPLRATSSIRAALEDVALSQGIPLIDVGVLMAEDCFVEFGHRCLGREYFLDHVHPTVETHGRIAQWILEGLIEENVVQGTPPTDEQRSRLHDQIVDSIDLDKQKLAFRNLAKVLHWAGKFEEAIPHARNAIRLDPEDLESRLILADSFNQIGQRQESLIEYETLFNISDYPRASASYGDLLWRMGRPHEAKSYLLKGVLSENKGHRARAFFALGGVHLQLGESAEALESLLEADRLYPDDPTTKWMIADALYRTGDWQAAVNQLKELATAYPRNFRVQLMLARILGENGRAQEAALHARQASELKPDDEEAIQLLEQYQ